MAVPSCKHCGASMIQRGRYADWQCACCDESVNCPHVSAWKRLKRKFAGRRV